jgi:hypothetical protein
MPPARHPNDLREVRERLVNDVLTMKRAERRELIAFIDLALGRLRRARPPRPRRAIDSRVNENVERPQTRT